MPAYYNEIDPYAAQWLRNLIAAGHIAPGVVDERDIRDILPSELAGFTQCHFFAGIGVWSHALRLAGWPDDRPVWTGSCPCQPFSAAGKGAGFADERHLWPAFFWLIRERRPSIVIGEQVASKDAEPWIDLVCDDVEALGYAFGAVPFPSAGVGSPHIRDRLYWVADADGGYASAARKQRGRQHGQQPKDRSARGAVDNADNARLEGRSGGSSGVDQRSAGPTGLADGVGDAERLGLRGEGLGPLDAASAGMQGSDGQRQWVRLEPGTAGTAGYWAECDWIPCRDDKWRPVEPGTFPLATGATARVGRLRAYGNAINAEAARVFIEACNL